MLALRDLFQIVYELKKKEVDDAKEKLEKGEVSVTGDEGNSQTSRNGSTSGTGQVGQTIVHDFILTLFNFFFELLIFFLTCC